MSPLPPSASGLPPEAFDLVASPMAEATDPQVVVGTTVGPWRRLCRRRSALVALLFLVVVVVLAIGSLWISPHDPTKQNIAYINLPPKISGLHISGLDGTAMVGGSRVDKYAAAGVPAGVHFIFGTDSLGRDLLSRLLMGVRYSLFISVVATALDLTLGVAVGLISGLGGYRVDTAIQRILEVVSGVPTLVVLVLMLTVFNPGLISIVLAMVVTGWIPMARLVRAQALRLREQEFILAARLLGARRWRLAIRHLLPNMLGIMLVQTMFTIPTAIFFEAFLSFIGIGLRPPVASLGTLLNEGFQTFTFLPFQMLIPAITLSLIMIAFNLLADGLRDAFDPRSR